MKHEHSSSAVPGIWRMAWRNISRRRRRSFLSAFAIGVAAAAMVVMLALMNGIKTDMADNIQRYFSGQIILEHRDYERAGVNALSRFIPDTAALRTELQAIPGIQAASPRITGAASVFVDGDAVFFPLMGQDFASDPMDCKTLLQPGGRLPENAAREALISLGLAQKLGLKVGDTLTLVTRTLRGSSNGMTLTVTGLLSSGMSQFQSPWLFTSLATAQRLVKLGDGATSVLLQTSPGIEADKVLPAVAALLKDRKLQDVQALLWSRTSSTMQLMGMFDLIYGIMALVFFALASTVIINTMLMVVLERQKEIGTLAALGMDRRTIQGLFLAESTLISALGAAAGSILGSVITLVLGVTGIDFSAVMQGLTMEVSSILRPVFSGPEALWVALGATAVAVGFTVLPTRRVLNMEIVEALRGEL